MSKLSLVGAMIMLLKEKPPDVRPSDCWVIGSKPDSASRSGVVSARCGSYFNVPRMQRVALAAV